MKKLFKLWDEHTVGFCRILCVICLIVPIIVYGTAVVKTTKMAANCITYFEMAANANSVELAEKHLTSGINYLEENNLTQGNTKVIFYTPTNDIGLWYENLKSAQTQLRELISKEYLTDLEESNTLMKLRETLIDNENTIDHPSMISFYPNHIGWFWALCMIWSLWIIGIIIGVVVYARC